MSIEIRQMSIKSSVVQRCRQDAGADDAEQAAPEAIPSDWREQCRRIVLELLEARGER